MDDILTSSVLIVLIIVLGVFALNNLNFVKESLGIEDDGEEDLGDGEASVLSDIFYLYNHDSEKQWLEWMNRQNHHTRNKAATMICNHLEAHPKVWGYATLEAIECLKGFKDLNIDTKLAAFLHKTSKLWQEYKSIPSFYEKAADILAKISPDKAIVHFREELDKHSGSQSSLEKKRILINALPQIKEKAKDLMIDVLSSSSESFVIKSHALRVTQKFPGKVRNEIYLETLRKTVKRYKESSRDLKTEEIHFVQDLISDSIKMIGQKDFYDVFNEICANYQLHKFVLDPLIKHIISASPSDNALDLYAASIIRDNTHNDVKKALAQKHALNDSELCNIVLKPTAKDITENLLISTPIEESSCPVPEMLRKTYDEFKTLFFKNVDDFDVVTSEKIFGAVLVTGNDDIEKIYLTKALAKEKNWNFGFVDIANIVSRESYNLNVNIFSKLRKPYVLYIRNPELFYIKTEETADTFREKFAQTLSIQSLDSKSFLVGDIREKFENTHQSDLGEAIKHLRYKFFPQTLEINKRPNTDRYKIAEGYLQHVSPTRFDSQQELAEKLCEQGKNFNSIEFMFFVLRNLATMLLVFGKGVAYSEVVRLEHRFKLTAGKLDTNADTSEIEKELDDLEAKINDENIINADEVQVEQNLEPPAQLDYEHES